MFYCLRDCETSNYNKHGVDFKSTHVKTLTPNTPHIHEPLNREEIEIFPTCIDPCFNLYMPYLHKLWVIMNM